jgi:tetratricopeptide (TPR) repeat protein
MSLTIKKPGEMTNSLQRLYERAQTAMNQQNYGYASEILRNILLAEPGFNEARLTLRQSQLERISFKANIFRQLLAMVTTAWGVFVKGPMALKKEDFAKAFDVAEKAMEADPTVATTLQFLADVALAAGLKEIAVNSMEIAVRFHPKSRGVLWKTAQVYQECDEAGKAIQMLQRLQVMQPNNLQIQNELKHATALAAMQQARWEQADSFRDLIRDKDLAETLEQQERITARDEESRKKLIDATLASIAEQPSAGLYKKLASLYHQNKEFDKAIEAYGKIPELTGNIDPAIENAITEVMSDRYNAEISALQAQLAEQPADKDEIADQIAKAQNERDQTMLERYKKRVQDYPNEMQYRFDLGMLLWNQGQIDQALREFQLSQRNPHFAKKSQLFMGKCMTVKKMYDMAIEQFTAALSDLDRISEADRKDALYELSVAYEQKGDREQAMARLKELYGIDVNYRDTAQRLEKFYQ